MSLWVSFVQLWEQTWQLPQSVWQRNMEAPTVKSNLRSMLRHAKWQELISNSFFFGRVWWSWKNWFWTISTLGRCAGLERTDFEQFPLWEGVVALKELILNSFYFGRVWCKCKTYMPLKKIRGVWIYGGVWGIRGGIWMYGGIKNIGDVQMPQTYGSVNSIPPIIKLTCH